MVERVVKLLPQLHVTLISSYAGWIPAFMATLPILGVEKRGILLDKLPTWQVQTAVI